MAEEDKSQPVDTTSRRYLAADRPRVVIKGWEDEEVYLTRINPLTAYFRGPSYVGEMAIESDKVIRIDE